MDNGYEFTKKLNISIEDRFPSRFSIIVKAPPKFCLKDINQIDMMSTNIKNVYFDMERNELKMQELMLRTIKEANFDDSNRIKDLFENQD